MDRTSKTQAGRDASTTEGEAMVINEELLERRDALLGAEPKLRGRALADRLGVSEAQILMLECGHSAFILRPEWPEIIDKVSSLGTVMAFTRNEWILHEKIGRYGGVSMNDSGNAVVVGEEINLRMFFDQWRFGFAVQEGILKSLQFFDRSGSAVHKIYLLDDSDPRAFDRLVQAYEWRPADLPLAIERHPRIDGGPTLDSATYVESFWSDWDSQRDLHAFSALLMRYGLKRSHAFRLAGDKRARQLPARMFERSLKMAAERQAPIVVQIESRGAVQMHAGTVTNVSGNGRWLNVIDPTFNLHLFEDAVAETWAVRLGGIAFSSV
jgi:putative hemin transport protein